MLLLNFQKIVKKFHTFFRQASTGSFGSDSTFAGGEGGEGGPPGVKITEIQAAWNVTNAIQGMFIVSLPFAVLRGGYWAIVAMVGIAHICCYTGKVKLTAFTQFEF
jgi:solute carrier family 32 (vesicular inhibitory amino acid transporter)